ncbi:MAG: DUF294 nucleotidyltransferase-like domain-containing protein [Parachlamydia sp.]|nr:DUF294 nucleotidyltransferase-like domain-containing protein [Parachlamydia sp.]
MILPDPALSTALSASSIPVHCLKPAASEFATSYEDQLKEGVREKTQGAYAAALLCYEKALHKSEMVKNSQQILQAVEYIGDLFLAKKEFTRAAKIYACCLALLPQKQVTAKQDHYLHKMKEVENAYLERSHLKKTYFFNLISPKTDPTSNIYKHRQYLHAARMCMKAKFDVKAPTEVLIEYATSMLQGLFKELICDSFSLMKQPPGKYAIIGIGSMGRREMSPYSDLEYAILIDQNNEDMLDYFKAFAHLIELKVVFLGETPYPILQKGQKSPLPEGFRLDSGGNTPLGELTPLLGTPEQLASYQKPHFFQHEAFFTSCNALRDSCYIEGDPSLYEEYLDIVKAIYKQLSPTVIPGCMRTLMGEISLYKGVVENILPLEHTELVSKTRFKCSKIEPIIHEWRNAHLVHEVYKGEAICFQASETLTVEQDYGRQVAQKAVKEFDPDLESKVLYKGKCVVIKRELYRLPSQFISVLALFYGLEERNYRQRCDQLVNRGKLSRENRDNIVSIMDEIFQLRFETQLHYEEEREEYYLAASDDLSAKCLVAKKKQLQCIKSIYQLLYPMHSILSLFSKHGVDRRYLEKARIAQPFSFAEEGKRCMHSNDIKGAIRAFKKEHALDPDNINTTFDLRRSESIMIRHKKKRAKVALHASRLGEAYAEVNALLQRSNGSNELDAFIKQFGTDLNFDLSQYGSLILFPFTQLGAHIETGLEQQDHTVLFFLVFLLEKLGHQFPPDLEVRWCRGCLDLHLAKLKKIKNPRQRKSTDSTYYQTVERIVEHLSQRFPLPHPHYPSPIIFIDLAFEHLSQGNHVRAQKYFDHTLRQLETSESARQAIWYTAIYEGLSRLARLAGNKEDASQSFEKAVGFAGQSSHALELMQRKRVQFEKWLAKKTLQEEVLLEEIPLWDKENGACSSKYFTSGFD